MSAIDDLLRAEREHRERVRRINRNARWMRAAPFLAIALPIAVLLLVKLLRGTP